MDLKSVEWEEREMHSSGSEWDQMACSCERGNESSGYREFINYLRNYSFLKTESAVWM